MRYLILALLFLTGCSTFQNIGIVHDYVIDHAVNACESKGGLHYIVSIEKGNFTSSFGSDSYDYYPCTSVYKFRCQNGDIVDFDSGITHCFISQSQIDETVNNKQDRFK